MKTRELIVTAVGVVLALVAGTAVADDDDGVLVFLFEGELMVPVPGVCPPDTELPTAVELLSPEDGDVEGVLTICINFAPIFVEANDPPVVFSGRFHDFGEMFFELDDETIRVPYTGIDALTFNGDNFVIPITNSSNNFTETILVVEAPGSPVRLFFAAVLEGFGAPILRGSVVLWKLDEAQAKVTIIHKGRTITIGLAALPAHLQHGDTLASP